LFCKFAARALGKSESRGVKEQLRATALLPFQNQMRYSDVRLSNSGGVEILYCLSQASFEVHLGLVAQIAPGSRDIRMSESDISGPRRGMLTSRVLSQDAHDSVSELEDAVSGSAPDIVNLAGCLLG